MLQDMRVLRHQWTVKHCAKRARCSPQMIYHMEDGSRYPSAKQLEKLLATVFQGHPDVLHVRWCAAGWPEKVAHGVRETGERFWDYIYALHPLKLQPKRKRVR
jgi:hypothetical protein